jgi:hypothetical protein
MSPSAGVSYYIVRGVFTHPRPGAVVVRLGINIVFLLG